MEANLPPKPPFPYSNWGPAAAVFGVILALATGIILGIPVLLFGQQSGGIERFDLTNETPGESLDSTNSRAIAVDSADGTVYAIQGSQVAALDPSGEALAGSPFGDFDDSRGIAVDGLSGRIYISDPDQNGIEVFRRGGDLRSPGPEVQAEAETSTSFEPGQIAVDQSKGPNSGDLYAIDRADDHVLQFSAAGATKSRLATGLDLSDEDDSGIAVDSSTGPDAGNVYVLGRTGGESAIVAFGPAGDSLWNRPAPVGGDPCGISVDSAGSLWIADPDSGLTEASVDGHKGLSEESSARDGDAVKNAQACGIAFGPTDQVYVAAERDPLTSGANAAIQLATALGFLIVPIAMAARGGVAFREALRRLGVRSFKVPSAFGWMFIAVVAYLLVAVLYANLIGEPKQEDIAESFGSLPIQFLLIVVAAPISEELAFRGMLYGGLREKLPVPVAALIGGLIFGALHALTGLSAVPPLMGFGIVLCLLYEKTGSIWPGIMLHMLNNTVALLSQ